MEQTTLDVNRRIEILLAESDKVHSLLLKKLDLRNETTYDDEKTLQKIRTELLKICGVET